MVGILLVFSILHFGVCLRKVNAFNIVSAVINEGPLALSTLLDERIVSMKSHLKSWTRCLMPHSHCKLNQLILNKLLNRAC